MCIVGRVGSGKSTFLSGLLGDTRAMGRGVVEFGGEVAYGKLFRLKKGCYVRCWW